MINKAKKGDIIDLPDSSIKVSSLYITKPVTLLGKPGSSLEVSGGSIFIDFSQSNETNESRNKLLETKNSFNDQRSSGNNTSIKRSEVAMISECQIIFNRNLCAQKNNEPEKVVNKASKTTNICKGPQQSYDTTQTYQKNQQKGLVGCFLVENNSYIEIRDCFIKSVKD